MSAAQTPPIVSVIVPTFNRLELLRQTVETLLAQTLANCEFVLVDDRSKEDVRSYLQALPAIDTRFQIIFKNGETLPGCQVSRNLGLKRCQGTWVMFLDSDDLLAPNCLEQRINDLTCSPGYDIYVGNQAIFRENTGKSTWVNLPKADQSELDRFVCIAAPIDIPWVNGGCLLRRSSLLDKGIKWEPGIHWDDVWFHIQCLVGGMKVRWLPRAEQPDSWYRIHGTEHYGNILHTEEGKINSAKMILKVATLLGARNLLDKQRSSQLSKVLFNTALLPLIDAAKWSTVSDLIARAQKVSLLDRSEWKYLRMFVLLRNLCCLSPKAIFFVNRIAKTRLLKPAFHFDSSTYDSLPTTPPVLTGK